MMGLLPKRPSRHNYTVELCKVCFFPPKMSFLLIELFPYPSIIMVLLVRYEREA